MEKNKDHSSIESLSMQQTVLLASLIIAAAIIGGAFIVKKALSGNGGGAAAATATAVVAGGASLDQISITNINTKGEPYVGNQKATVVVAYWNDYQASASKLFATNTLPNLIKKYVATGKVAILFKDYAGFGADSNTAALYGRAVWALYPRQYFDWWTAMMNAQDRVNQGFGDEASIIKLTATIPGIDVTKVHENEQTNISVYQAAIDADKAEGAKMGIIGTPSFLTGTTIFKGYASEIDLTKAIEDQLK